VDPKNFVLHFKNLEYFAKKHYAPQREGHTPSFTDFIRIPLDMRCWVEQELLNTDRPKTLVIWGPSRMEKTSWARSLGRHTYIGYQWSVRELDLESTYIVVDDIEMSNFKLWQPFIGK
jgi:Begomovirus replication-associated protein